MCACPRRLANTYAQQEVVSRNTLDRHDQQALETHRVAVGRNLIAHDIELLDILKLAQDLDCSLVVVAVTVVGLEEWRLWSVIIE